MPISFGRYSYCLDYKESGDLSNKNTVVGNFSGINSVTVFGFHDYGHSIGEISNFPFGWVAPNLTNEGYFKCLSFNKASQINRTTIIGNDVWIGANVTLKCGVKICDGAIVAYNSNVTKDVPPYSVVGGNPAKIIRKRYSDEIIDKLLLIQWWNWDDNKIKENTHWFTDKTIHDFINHFYTQ